LFSINQNESEGIGQARSSAYICGMIEQILRDLYASEINASLSWFWDGGFDVALGDEMNGYGAQDTVSTLDEAAEWLRSNAVQLYPDSEFAKKHRRGFE